MVRQLRAGRRVSCERLPYVVPFKANRLVVIIIIGKLLLVKLLLVAERRNERISQPKQKLQKWILSREEREEAGVNLEEKMLVAREKGDGRLS